MKLQITIDLDIKIDEDKEHVAATVTRNLKEYLDKYLRQVESTAEITTRAE